MKTSLAPGSPAAESYLRRSGLLADLEALGFAIVGFGCTTCIGNSGALVPGMVDAIENGGILPVAVLSGNRNFPGRVHPQIEASFLASPPLVIAYALAGHVNLDILNSPSRTPPTAGDLPARPLAHRRGDRRRASGLRCRRQISRWPISGGEERDLARARRALHTPVPVERDFNLYPAPPFRLA